MTVFNAHPVLMRPPSVTVHDYRYVIRHVAVLRFVASTEVVLPVCVVSFSWQRVPRVLSSLMTRSLEHDLGFLFAGQRRNALYGVIGHLL